MFAASTMLDSIEAAKNEAITHDKLFIKAVCTETNDKSIIIFNINSLITKYIEEIKKKYIQKVALTDEELNKYKFKPKLFCKDMYGTTELWSSLLLINNMISQVDFTASTIYAFKPSIIDFINEMNVLEENNINDNIQYIENIKKNNK